MGLKNIWINASKVFWHRHTEILKFFKTKLVPVSATETLELFTFMAASNESKRLGGKPVSMKQTFEKAEKQAQKKLSKLK